MIDTLTIVTDDCSRLIPPCWQELHYLYGGILVGLIIAIPIFEWLRSRWTAKQLIVGWLCIVGMITVATLQAVQSLFK